MLSPLFQNNRWAEEAGASLEEGKWLMAEKSGHKERRKQLGPSGPQTMAEEGSSCLKQSTDFTLLMACGEER